MSDALEVLKRHFAVQSRRAFVLPLGPGFDLTLYHDPMTLMDLEELRIKPKLFPLDMYAQVIVLKALRADGSKAFTEGDLPELRRLVVAAVLVSLGEAILDQGPTPEQVGEPSGGRNARSSAPPSLLPMPGDFPPPPSTDAHPSPSCADGSPSTP